MKLSRFLFTVAAFASVPVFAQSAPASNLPPALAAATRAGVKIEKSFPALSGMTGYVLNRQGEYSIVYSTPDNQALVNGMLIGPDGKNMTPVYSEMHIPKPDFDGLWGSLEKSTVIATGAKGAQVKSVVYAFLDPNCVYCNLAWKAFKPYEAAGLQVRWVPVAFLNASSTTKMAAILQSVDPAGALDVHESRYKAGGVDAQGVTVKDETRAKLEANSRLMREFGFNGTPAVVYKDAKTGKVLTKNGMPSLRELPAMLNLPSVPNSDPDLARFE